MGVMTPPGIRGLWHLALRVTDLARSRVFYETLFGMRQGTTSQSPDTAAAARDALDRLFKK